MQNIIRDMQYMAARVAADQVSQFVDTLADAFIQGNQVIGIGAGRMGYSCRAHIMRLAHLGFKSSMIGDTSVPRVYPGDIVIVNSSSGSTPTSVLYAQQAYDAGAYILSLTTNPESPIAKMSKIHITVPVSIAGQIMKTSYEQFSMLLLDHIAALLLEKLELDVEYVTHNHSILE